MKNILNFISTLYNIRRDFICISLWVVVIGSIMMPQLMFAQEVQNHYKTWMIEPQTYDARVLVQDQFMEDSLTLVGIELLSNPTLKVHESQPFPINDPDDHLTWYRAVGRDTSINLAFKNQFESTAVSISKVEYLLVPTQKQGHGPPTNLDHYKAYRITDPQMLRTPVMLQDQFDDRYGSPENIDSLLPTFFLTPAVKNLESQLYDSVTHYVAYMI
ncbi:MAG: hypothetical protein HY800_06050, partial [Ignavibacteriales bacterium]|nr:hypothetical protein [Ignavibacteriales bacterium]